MLLSEYLRKRSMSLTEFAERLGVVVSTVSRYASGERIPSRDLMLRIERETGGRVKPGDFYGFKLPP